MKNDLPYIVTFVGGTDLMAFDIIEKSKRWSDKDDSPIKRVLVHLANEGRLGARFRLLLLDDKPGSGEREEFTARFRVWLRDVALLTGEVDVIPFSQDEGPTDYNRLFKQVWKHVPHEAPMRDSEVNFHLSSGTPAMQCTLVLAALCLPLRKARLFETSSEKGCLEVQLPYVVALRARRFRTPKAKKRQLANKARKTLLPNLVVEDEEVQRQFNALFRAAQKRTQLPRIIVAGPIGSGKSLAARQYAHWAGVRIEEWTADTFKQSVMPVVPDGAAILVRRIEGLESAELARLQAWQEKVTHAPFVVTFTTNRRSSTSWNELKKNGMPGAAEILLPSLTSRTDIIEVAESMSEEFGLRDTKMKERLQHEIFSAPLTKGLHSLRSLLATAACHSESIHMDHGAFELAHRTREAVEACELLLRTGEMIAGLELGERLSLDEALDGARVAAFHLARAGGRTQQQAADLLGSKQQKVSRWLEDHEKLEKLQAHLRDLDEQS